MTEQGPEQSAQTGAALSRSLDWRPQGSLPTSVLLWFFECQLSCLTQIGATHNLVEGGLCPTTARALTSDNHQHG